MTNTGQIVSKHDEVLDRFTCTHYSRLMKRGITWSRGAAGPTQPYGSGPELGICNLYPYLSPTSYGWLELTNDCPSACHFGLQVASCNYKVCSVCAATKAPIQKSKKKNMKRKKSTITPQKETQVQSRRKKEKEK